MMMIMWARRVSSSASSIEMNGARAFLRGLISPNIFARLRLNSYPTISRQPRILDRILKWLEILRWLVAGAFDHGSNRARRCYPWPRGGGNHDARSARRPTRQAPRLLDRRLAPTLARFPPFAPCFPYRPPAPGPGPR